MKYLRAIADDKIGPEEAVRAYHGDLQRLGIQPYRRLQDDLQRAGGATSYSGSGSVAKRAAEAASVPSRPVGEPDFSQMTPAEKAQWNLERWKRILG